MRAELLGLVNTLPEVFDEVMNAICGDEIGSSLDFYQAFVAYAHTKPEASFSLRASSWSDYVPSDLCRVWINLA